MYRIIAFVSIGLMITDSSSDYLDEEEDWEKRQKRRVQNVKAAQKSYQAKKQFRENLQQKNTELVETQMQLLHEKSRLQERVQVLERVMNNLNHIYKTCSNHTNPTSELKTRPHSDVVNGDIMSPCASISVETFEGQTLNVSMSINNKHDLSSCSDSSMLPERSGSRHGSTNVLGANEILSKFASCDESILDESFLDVGATQEVIVERKMVSRKDRRANNNSVWKDDSVFIPTPKKTKRGKTPKTRTLRTCATDALKKQRSTGINMCGRDRMQYK